MRRLLSSFFFLLCLVPASAQTVAKNVQKAADGTNAITESLTFASGKTLSGAGTFDFSSGTLTLPASLTGGGTSLVRRDALGSNVYTWLGTPSSANLAAALTDETGSGSLVFATSPTLTTPNIGAATGTSLLVTGADTKAYSATNGATFNDRLTLTNSQAAATGQNAFIAFTNPANVASRFGYVQTASGLGDFVWNQFTGSAFFESMRLTGAAGNLSLAGTLTVSGTGTSSVAGPLSVASAGTGFAGTTGQAYFQRSTSGDYGRIIIDNADATKGSIVVYKVNGTSKWSSGTDQNGVFQWFVNDSSSVANLSTAGALTLSSTLTVSGTGTSSFAGAIQSTGAIGTSTASSAIFDYSSGARVIARGSGVGSYGVVKIAGTDSSGSAAITGGIVATFDSSNGATTLAGNLTVTGAMTATTSGVAIKGTTTNDNAATGYVGEYVSSTVAVGSAVSLTNNVVTQLTSLTLSAGDWDVDGTVAFTLGGTTTITSLVGGISTATGSFSNDYGRFDVPGFGQTTSIAPRWHVPTQRFSLSATTTIYLLAYSQFATSTNAAWGQIQARRVR